MKVQQYWKLKNYEEILKTALYCDYFRNLTQKTRNELDEIYFDMFKEKSSFNAGCGGCQLKSLKKLAKPYFEMKEKMEKKKVEENIITEQTPEIENGTGEETTGEG